MPHAASTRLHRIIAGLAFITLAGCEGSFTPLGGIGLDIPPADLADDSADCVATAPAERTVSAFVDTPLILNAADTINTPVDPTALTWNQTAGPPVDLTVLENPRATFNPTDTGTYGFRLDYRDAGDCPRQTVFRVTITERPAATPLPIVSTFDDGDDGWRLDGGSFDGLTAPDWDRSEQNIFVEDGGFPYWVAPDEYRGNLANAYGTAIAFDMGWNANCCTFLPLVVLSGGGRTLHFRPDYSPNGLGTSYMIWLDEREPWFDAATNRRARVDQIRTVLADVRQFQLLSGGFGFSWLDDVTFGYETPAPLTAPVVSTFDAGDEGWRLLGGAFGRPARPQYDDENGHLQTRDSDFAVWTAPTKFKGNFINFYGARLTFDSSWQSSCCTGVAQLVLFGGGHQIVAPTLPTPINTFTNLSVELAETAGWTFQDNNSRVGRDDFLDVLSNLQRIRILAGGDGLSRLDEVVFGAN